MDLRVTFNTLIDRVLSANRSQQDRLAVLQQRALKGRELLKPSDAPLDANTVFEQQADQSRLDTYVENISQARLALNVTTSSLQDVASLLARARQIAVEGSNSFNDSLSREALAAEVDALLERLAELVNTRHLGRYVFAGAATDTQPFVFDDSTGRYVYQGSDQSVTVAVGVEARVEVFAPGSSLFQPRRREPTVFEGTTGAAPGSGTDSGTGEGTLLVKHVATVYAGGSGVQPGISSATGDTIIGPAGAHQLSVVDTSGTGTSGTVSLNGGTPVAFTNSDTDLRVEGPQGEVVFIDTSAITPGFNGTVAITASGSLSVDGGRSSLPIDFTDNQPVVHSLTGEVTHVDSTNIRRTGTEHIRYPGTFDVFQILQALRDDLRNTRDLPEPQLIETISGRLAEIDRLHDAVLARVGTRGADQATLDLLEERHRATRLDYERSNADLLGTDLAKIIVELQAQETQLRLAQAVTVRMFEQSLLDFLR